MDRIRIINGDKQFLCQNISDAEGFEFPTTRPIIEDVASRVGTVYITSSFGRRPLSWKGLIRSNTPAQRRLLIDACNVGNLKTILFDSCDGISLQAEVEIINLISPYRKYLNQAIYHIEAVAPDYRFYSQTESMIIIGQSVLTGGSSIPTDIAMSFPLNELTSTELSRIVINQGNVETDPIFTISGPGNGFIITNVTSGEEFTINESLSLGESIVINVKERTVIKEGTENIYPLFSGRFWSLISGENQLRFLVQSDFDTNTQLTLSFRSAYTGI